MNKEREQETFSSRRGTVPTFLNKRTESDSPRRKSCLSPFSFLFLFMSAQN